MTCENQHLVIPVSVLHEFNKSTRCGTSALVIKVHQSVIHNYREGDALFVQVTHKGKPQREKNLFSSPAAKSFWVPDHTSSVMNVKSGFIRMVGLFTT